MRAVAAIIILAVIALVIGLTWYLISYRHKVQARRETELNANKRVLRKIDVALDAFVATDPMERVVVDNVRSAILDFYATTGQPTKRRAVAAGKARRAIALELSISRSWMLHGVSSDEAKRFCVEASKALRDNEKEIPA